MSAFVKSQGRYFFLSNSLSAVSRNPVSKPILTQFFAANAAVRSSVPSSILYKLPTANNVSQGPGFAATLRAAFFPLMKYPQYSKSTTQVVTPLLKQLSGGTRAFATHRETGGWRGRGSYGGSKWSRVLGYLKVPLAFTTAVLAFNVIVLPYAFQIPGVSMLQRRPDYVVYGLMAMNLAVFLAWKSPRSFGRQLYRYGLLHKDAQFNKWSMIGSAFSHQEFWHLGINMFVLYQFGLPLAKWVGSKDFIEMYFDGAVLASLGSLAIPMLINTYTPYAVVANIPSLGASGAIFTIFGAFSYLVPYARLSFFFVPLPIGAWYVFLLTMGYNGFRLFTRSGGMDYAGHFAGGAAGILWGYVFSEKIKRQRQVTLKRY